ncbi:MAG TPA: hypothetical protein ENK57_04940 [Polyangiaceae bacterium]|nr:hypothetical protein [Polyangiaceae bacterium]
MTSTKRLVLASSALALAYLSFSGLAGAQDPYEDPPAPAPKAPAPKAPAPKAPPVAPAPKAPAPKAPAPKAPAPKAPAPKAEPQPAPVPPPPEKAAPADEPEPKGADAGAKPELPSWHPPVQPQGKVGAEDRRKRLEELMKKRAQQARAKAKGQAEAAPEEPAKPKHPVDAHGYCIGDGPQDRPKDINLFHGWLGVNNDKAVPAPPKGGGEDWWGKEYFGNKDWWTWRLTPHPWRYENHDDHCDPRNQPIPLLANVINVGVLLFLLIRFGRKPVEESLRKRKKSIMSEIDKAQRIKKDAKGRLRRYEDELDHLEDKLEALREQYAAEGAREEQRAKEEAEEARARMIADAEFRVSQESKTARDNLSREALEEALHAAEALLVRTISQADHDRLAEEYLDQIGPALTADQEES